MTHFPGAALVTLGALLVAGEARGDTLELVTYTPPPGWSAQRDASARAFVRKDAAGVGIVMVFAGRPAGGAPADAFAEEWRARVAPLFPGPAPKPVVQAMGDVTVALAMSQGSYEGQTVGITFVTLVGRGRAQSVVGIASGKELQAQVSAFIGGVGIAPATGAPAPAAPPPASGGDVELEVAAPPGYALGRDPRGVVIAPLRLDRATSCSYGVTPPRASQGNLEADAHAAFAEVFAGWEKRGSEEHYHLKRGFAAAGWPFFWYRGELQRLTGGTMTYAYAMTMVVPAGPRRVSVLWGIGDLATCTMEDRTFALLFHSLRPRGWSSDGGKTFAQQLPGSWILSTGRGSAIYQFDAGGRYVYALNATTSVYQISDATALKTTAQLYHEGRYTLRGNELELVRDDKPQTQRVRIRIVDEYEVGTWTRGLYLLGDGDEIQYLRQNWRP